MLSGVYIRTKEMKNGFKKGHIPWNKGSKAQTNTGKTHFKKGAPSWNKGTVGVMKSNNTSFRKGLIPWNKGTKGEYQLWPNGRDMSWMRGENNLRWKGGKPKCKVCNKLLASIYSKRCTKCHSISIMGKNHPNWKGGITKIAEKIRKSGAYMEWRRSILLRDNFICLTCNVRGGRLNVDHYPKTFSQIIHEYKINSLEKAINCNELWETSNGRTLCEPCHKLTPTYLRNTKKEIYV